MTFLLKLQSRTLIRGIQNRLLSSRLSPPLGLRLLQTASPSIKISPYVSFFPRGAPYCTTIPTRQYRSSEKDESSLGPNPGLQSVISQGLPSLERIATEVHAKTKKQKGSVATATSRNQYPSYANNSTPDTTTTMMATTMPYQKAQTPRQLAEGQRILEVATECIEALCRRSESSNQRNTLAIGGEPLTLLHVQVNSNARQAKVYWTLPYRILLDERLTPTAYQRLMNQVEAQLDGSALQREVHIKLSFYFPPRLKFYPATSEMVAQAMEELL